MFEEDFITRYNSVIARLKKADKFLEDEKNDIEIRIGSKPYGKHNIMEMYNGIIKELSDLQIEYLNKFEKEMDLEEKLNGFSLTM